MADYRVSYGDIPDWGGWSYSPGQSTYGQVAYGSPEQEEYYRQLSLALANVPPAWAPVQEDPRTWYDVPFDEPYTPIFDLVRLLNPSAEAAPTGGTAPSGSGFTGGFYGGRSYGSSSSPRTSSGYTGYTGPTGDVGDYVLGGVDLYEVLRNMMGARPPLDVTAAGEQYPYYTAPYLEQLKATIMDMVPGVEGKVVLPATAYSPAGKTERVDVLDPVRQQTGQVFDVAAQWAPEQGEVGGRRTALQQAQFGRDMSQVLAWGPPEPTLDTESSAAVRQAETLQRSIQQNAWSLWSPMLKELAGPRTWEGGGPQWLGPTAEEKISPAPSRRYGWTPYSGGGSSWSFTPRWG